MLMSLFKGVACKAMYINNSRQPYEKQIDILLVFYVDSEDILIVFDQVNNPQWIMLKHTLKKSIENRQVGPTKIFW